MLIHVFGSITCVVIDSIVVLCCVVLCCGVLCCVVLCCVVLCCVVLCCVVLCCVVLCGIASFVWLLAIAHSSQPVPCQAGSRLLDPIRQQYRRQLVGSLGHSMHQELHWRRLVPQGLLGPSSIGSTQSLCQGATARPTTGASARNVDAQRRACQTNSASATQSNLHNVGQQHRLDVLEAVRQ
jgi:hypothetical protein